MEQKEKAPASAGAELKEIICLLKKTSARNVSITLEFVRSITRCRR